MNTKNPVAAPRRLGLTLLASAMVMVTGTWLLPRAHAEAPITHSLLVTGNETYIIEYKPQAASKALPGKNRATPAKEARADILFEDFEKETYEGWTVTGTAFGKGPVAAAEIPKYQGNVNAKGKRLVNSHHTRNGEEVGKGDAHVGSLTSKPFKIERNFIAMMVGGGNHRDKTCVNLVVGGKVVRSLTGDASNRMRPKQIDVKDLQGQEASLQIVDSWDKGWGNIGVDHIVFTDKAQEGKVGSGRGGDVSGGGKIVWRYPARSRDGWVLDNGHVLLALNGTKQAPGGSAVIVDRKGKKLFEYKGKQKEVQAVQPLENGNILVVEGGPKPQLMEITREGEIAVRFDLQCQKKNFHMQTRMARKLANGNYLAPHLLDFAVKEYDKTGKVVRVIKTDDQGQAAKSWPFTAIRLENGNTVIGCTYANRVIEVDPEGKIVWQLTNKDLPQPLIKDACGVQRLPNGNTVVTSYGARGNDRVKLFEVTRDKKLVWTHRSGKAHGVHHFQVLDTNGKPLEGTPMK